MTERVLRDATDVFGIEISKCIDNQKRAYLKMLRDLDKTGRANPCLYMRREGATEQFVPGRNGEFPIRHRPGSFQVP